MSTLFNAPPPEIPLTADTTAKRGLEISMRDHQICFVVPAGSRIEAFTLDLPGGILVLGALRGKVTCAAGNAIIAHGGEFQGSLDAADVYIEGRISSRVVSGTASLSRIVARGSIDASGELAGGIAAFGSNACVQAHVQARAFHVPRHADLKQTVLETI
ncbi:MAG: polymer-forming cytoskeletal protein [Pseudomonadota bacterium]